MNLNQRVLELQARLGALLEQHDAVEEGLSATRAELKHVRALLAEVQARAALPVFEESEAPKG